MQNETATIWPPPPSDTPQTYVIEGTEITISAEQLAIYAPKLRRVYFLLPATLGLLIPICGWLCTVWQEMKMFSPLGASMWKDMLSWTAVYIFMGTSGIANAWLNYRKKCGGGRFVFRRGADSIFVGKQLLCNFANVKRIRIRPVSPPFRKPYAVMLDLQGINPNTGKPFVSKWSPYRYQLVGHFRDYTQAEIFAEEVAEFIGVLLTD